MAAKLGQILITSGVITEAQLNEALSMQKRGGGRLGTNLVKLGHITEDNLMTFLSKQYGMSAINLAEFKIDPAVLKLIPAAMAKKYMIMPLTRAGAKLTVAMADPSNVFAVDDIKFMTGYNVEVVIATESALMNAITTYYGGKVAGLAAAPERLGAAQKAMKLEAKDYTLSDTDVTGEEEAGSFGEGPTVDVDEFDRIVGDALDDVEHVTEDDMLGARGEIEEPIVKLVSGILINAIKIGASDIHIEPYENSVRVRYRVDGVLALAMNLPLRIKNSVVSRLKIMAKLDISERRLPQDGRIKLRLGKNKEVDLRVAILPCLFGEKKFMRILDKASLQVDLTKIVFEEEALLKFLECLNK
ncbi:MAG: ATPase, T2SS/T4P/T4SS family, partial [Nitrospirota bacterium]|nr:ATPase, T2SS/T4P/T4SS family [Nitrospirota bacterium]